MIRKIDSNIFSLTILKVTTFSRIRHLSIKKQKKLREITGMKVPEIPVCFVGIGMPTEKMRIAKSRRLSIEQVLNFVD